MDEFATEVLRILQCPYTPSLKGLHEVVQKTDPKVLQLWSRCHACQVDGLAAAILEGLELWPYALDILRVLSYVPEVKNAIMLRQPVLLDQILSAAVESDSAFEKFAPVCTAMLSTPLSLATPSKAFRFFEMLLEKAVNSKSPEAIRNVHRALTGLGTSYLDDIVPDSVIRFQDHLIELLAQLDMNDPFANLLCLAVLAKFASRPQRLTSEAGDRLLTAQDAITTDCYSPARKYFVGKRAFKTLDLTILKVINACSRNSSLSIQEAEETLTLAGQVVETLDSQDKRIRLEKNSQMLRNLFGKILRSDIDTTLQVRALNFIAGLYDSQELPAEVKPVFKRIVLEHGAVSFSTDALRLLCINSFGPSLISECLLGLLRLSLAANSPMSDTIAQLDVASRKIASIIRMLPSLTDSDNLILENLATEEAMALLHQLASYSAPRTEANNVHDITAICSSTFIKARTLLLQQVTFLVLSLGLRSSTCDPSLSGLLITLLENNTEPHSGPIPCPNFCQIKKRAQLPSVSFFESGSTPQSTTISHNWRHNLVRELSREANCQYDSVTRMVGNICRDLELRCNEVELPLREEQAKSCDLEARLEDTQTKVTGLETHIQAQSFEMDNRIAEKTNLADQCDIYKTRLQEVSQQLEQLRDELNRVKEDNEHTAQIAMERSREKDVDYMTIIAGKDSMLDEQASRLDKSENRAKNLEDELARHQTRVLDDAERIKGNEALIQDLETRSASMQDLANSRQAEIDRLRASEVRLSESIKRTEKLAQEDSEQRDAIIADKSAQLKSVQYCLEELQMKHEQNAKSKEKEIQDLEVNHRSACTKLQGDLREARAEVATARDEGAWRIGKLKKQVKQLRKEREERAAEVAEARSMKSGLLAFMNHMDDQGAMARKQETEIDEGEQSSLDPLASSGTSNSSINEHTLKRKKRNPSSSQRGKSIATKPTPNTRGVRSSMVRSRTPLADLDTTPNPTPTQRITWGKALRLEEDPVLVSQENAEPHHSWIDESFDGGEVFTSTDERHLSALRTPKPTKNDFDETTADV